jgi:hypothetical protein
MGDINMTTSTISSTVLAFREELEVIESADLKTFLMNSLAMAPASYGEDALLIDYTKRVFKLTKEIVETEGLKGMLKDMMLGSILLADMMENEMPEAMKELHSFAVATHLKELKNDLSKAVWDGMMNLIEQHEGHLVTTASVEPKPGQPGYIIALAHRIARFNFVAIKL